MLVPRETPLSSIHLQRPRDAAAGGGGDPLRRAGLLPRRQTIDDLVDFVVARFLDQLGLDNALVEKVGPMTVESGALSPDGVRRMFDRIAPVYDVMNRVMTAGLDRAGGASPCARSCGRAIACSTPAAAPAISRSPRARRAPRSSASTSPSRCSSAHGASRATIDWVQGDLLALPFDDASFDAATVGFGVRNVDDLERGLGELRRVLRPGGRARHPRDHAAARAAAAVLPPLVRRAHPARGQDSSRREGLHVSARERPPLPRPGGARGADGGRASARSRTGGSRAASSRSTRGGA